MGQTESIQKLGTHKTVLCQSREPSDELVILQAELNAVRDEMESKVSHCQSFAC